MAETTTESPATSSLRVEPPPASPMGRRRPIYRSLSSLSPRPRGSRSPRSSGGFPEPTGRYFLDACALCKKPLAPNRDIFMYRGDTAFCSEECRQEQIDMDEVKERKWGNLAAKALERAAQSKEEIRIGAAGTVVVG